MPNQNPDPSKTGKDRAPGKTPTCRTGTWGTQSYTHKTIASRSTTRLCLSDAAMRNKDICRFLVAQGQCPCRACGALQWSLLRVHWDTCACLLLDRLEAPRA